MEKDKGTEEIQMAKRVILIVSMMMLMTLTGLFTILPQDAKATTLDIEASSTNDGYITKSQWKTFPYPVSYTSPGSASTLMVGSDDTSNYYYTYRSFFSFDTSSIPSNAVIRAATVTVRLNIAPSYTTDEVILYSSDYGVSVDNGDWDCQSQLQGVIMNGHAVDSYTYSLNINPMLINFSGYTSFSMKSNNEGSRLSPVDVYWYIWSSYGSSSTPKLSIDYEVVSADVDMELDSGNWLNSTMYPEISEYNKTHNMYYFAFDTVPDTKNVTIAKSNQSWGFAGMVPGCNYTDSNDSLILEDVYDSICYRVWFIVPKLNPYSSVYISLYDQFTGEGLMWESMSLYISEGGSFNNTTGTKVYLSNFFLTPYKEYTIQVQDYFGNAVTNYTFTTSIDENYLPIPIPIYNYKFYNQNPTFAKLEIYYNLLGEPYTEFIPPNDYVSRFLKAGTYRFNITFYNDTGVQGDTYTWVRTIPSPTFPGAGFVILTGTTIAEVIDAVNGVQALVEVVTELVMPSVIWIGRDIPQIPSYILTVSEESIINNLYMLSATTVQTENGTDMIFSSPFPLAAQDSIIEMDFFRFSGPYNTQVFINDTESGLTVYSSATLPPSVIVTGTGAYEVGTNNSVTCVREVDFRWYRAFTYQYEPSIETYTAEIVLVNDLSTAWYNATLFIPFMNGSYVNNNSIEIWDMNNTVYLYEGYHWLQCEDGIYMWFDQLNASVIRGFRLTYSSTNESNLEFPVHIEVNKVGDDSGITYVWQSKTFYFARASWTNDYRETYHNSIYIDLTFDLSVDSESVVVLMNNMPLTNVIVAQKTIIIPEVTVPVGETVDYVILFDQKSTESIFDLNFAGVPIIMTTGFLALGSFIMGMYFVQFRKDKRSETWGRTLIGFAVLCIALIIVVFIYALGTIGG